MSPCSGPVLQVEDNQAVEIDVKYFWDSPVEFSGVTILAPGAHPCQRQLRADLM